MKLNEQIRYADFEQSTYHNLEVPGYEQAARPLRSDHYLKGKGLAANAAA